MICKEQLTSVLINNHQLLHLTSSKRWLRRWMRTRVPALQPLNPLMPDKGEEAHSIHQRDGRCSISQIQNHSAQCHSALRREDKGRRAQAVPPDFPHWFCSEWTGTSSPTIIRAFYMFNPTPATLKSSKWEGQNLPLSITQGTTPSAPLSAACMWGRGTGPICKVG